MAEITREQIEELRRLLAKAKAADLLRSFASEPKAGAIEELCKALTSYQQADEDGVMVLVSRQACDEAAALIRRLERERDDARIELGNAGEDYREQQAKLRNTFADAQSMKDRATTAEAEAERLRAALKWIAGHQLGAANGQPDNRLDPLSGASCVRRARTALEGKTDGK